MSKESYALSAIVVSGLVVSLGVSMYVFSNPKETTRTAAAPNSAVDQISNVASNQLPKNTYRDESGFSFSYVSDLLVTDATPGAGPYYTILNLQKGSESMRFTVEDTAFLTIDDWLARETLQWELVGAVSLDGVPAKQYRSATHEATVMVDQGILYILKSPVSPEWEAAHELMVSTFAFDKAPVATTQSPVKTEQTVAGGGIIYDPEIIVE